MASTPQSSKLGLQPYQGNWSMILTKHLLNRTLFSATSSEIKYFNSIGLKAAVSEILTISSNLPSGAEMETLRAANNDDEINSTTEKSTVFTIPPGIETLQIFKSAESTILSGIF